MNKVKMFFIAAALVLTTAGVFAGKAKFVAFALYASKNATPTTLNSQPLVGSATWTDLSTSGSTQANIVSSNGNGSYGLYYNPSGTTLVPVYTSGF